MNDAALALGARIVLALVLASSAFVKLRARAAVHEQVATLVSERAAPVIAPLLPAAELLVGVALVAWWSAVPGIVAVVLLVLFTIVLVRAEARRVPCLCFGASKLDTPVGPAGIVRNGVLAALAVFAIASPTGATAAATIVAVAGFGVIAALAVRAAR
ncbi:MAG: Methylamine utilization protein MauE [Actinomycetota bacterium]|nr:Methylamine utilization protein MauE [Actinomycetota bacterium]